jgi:N-acetylmuramic acid 6-phosphate etherase
LFDEAAYLLQSESGMRHLMGVSNVNAAKCGSEVFLAIDGGGSKTDAVAFLSNGHVLARVVLHTALNPNGAEIEMSQVLAELLDRLGREISLDAVAGVFVGLAGGSDAHVQAKVKACVASLLPAVVQVPVMHDAGAALWSGIEQVPGMALIAGTGTVAFGIDTNGNTFRVGGWGYLLGDAGGGYDLGLRALKAITAVHDGRGTDTTLMEQVLSAWRLTTVPELVPLVYQDGKKRIAALAPMVCEAAGEGDAVATRIVSEVAGAAAVLLRDALQLAESRDAVPCPFSVVLVGGLWGALEFKQAFDRHLREMSLMERVTLIRPSLPPVFGGARLLMHACQLKVDTVFSTNFQKSLVEMAFESHGPFELKQAADQAPRSESSLDLGALGTERGNPAMRDLDTWDTLTIVNLIATSNKDAIAAVAAEAKSIAAAVEGIYARLSQGGRLFYVGAGTSGRLGVLDASECPPTFGVSFEKVQGVIAGGESALIYPAEGAEDDASQGGKDLQERGLSATDVVVAIAASGRTPYCIGALQAARAAEALTVSVSCNKAALLSQYAEFPIEVNTGAEMIAGSTRMKAGTAQKVVLNTLTTTVMIRLGKVFGGHMVDMLATNQKLILRARRIVMLAGELENEDVAGKLLERAQGNIKAAIVMAHTKATLESAQEHLAANRGYVRQAISAARNNELLGH